MSSDKNRSTKIIQEFQFQFWKDINYATVLPAKSDSDIMFCLQSYQGLMIDRSLVY